MRTRFLIILTLIPLGCWIAFGQGRGGNWPTFGGDAQRSGWESADSAISRDSIKDMQLLWKLKFDTQAKGNRPVTPPLILQRLISYRGFKELAFLATNADIVYALDADLGTVFWQKHLEYSTRETQVTTSSWRCPGGLTATPTMPVAARGGAAAGRGAPPAAGQRASAFIGGTGPASVYAISSDGRLHRLNISTGDDMTQPINVIPANARASSLNMVDNVIYTVTSQECNGVPNAVWAIDLGVDPPKVQTFALNGGSGWGLGGAAIGGDGTVYVRDGDRLLALRPRDLQLKDYFLLHEKSTDNSRANDILPAASPLVWSLESRDFIVTDCGSGQLCLLDGAAFGGSDHNAPLFKTSPLAQAARNEAGMAERGTWGHLTSWQDTDGSRWVLASVLGPPSADLKAAVNNGPAPNGFVVAFKVQQQEGKRTLEPAWISRDLQSPLPPVVANGVVFALSAGEFTRQVQKTLDELPTLDERAKGSTRATLYALDARTGKELYSSKNLIPVPAALTGLTVTSGRVYFGGADGSFYAFGMYMEH